MTEHRDHPYIPKLKRELADGRIGRRDFLRTATLLGLSAASAYAAAGLVAPRPAQAQPATPGKTRLRIGMRVNEIGRAHATSSVEGSNILRQVCDYLTLTDRENITHPVLLERWEASEDLKTWTFYIRPEARWRTGRPFLADDVVWNIKHVLDPATGSSVLGLMRPYMMADFDDGLDAQGKPKKSSRLWDAQAIEKLDDHTVRLNCRSAQLAVPEHMFHYPFMMIDPAEGGTFKPGSNGTGAFTLTDYAIGSKAVLAAVPNHWRKTPAIGTLEFIDLGGDPSAWLAAMASKQVDGLYEVDDAQLDVMQALPDVKIYEVSTAQTGVARVKYNQKPFDDNRVRQAFKLAVDPQKIIDVVFRGRATPGENHHVAPIHPEYAKLPTVKPDPARAKQLLAEAGYKDGLTVEITVRNSPAWEANAVTVMAEQWADVGIHCKINSVPTSVFWKNWTAVPFGFTSWAHRPLGIMTLSLAYRTGGTWNESDYSNPEFDALLTQAEGQLDVDERRKTFAKIEAMLQVDGPIVQPLWRIVRTGYDKRVQGFSMHPTQYIFAETLSV
jgi:peptide/nickel transport system substrate-binding protein